MYLSDAQLLRIDNSLTGQVEVSSRQLSWTITRRVLGESALHSWASQWRILAIESWLQESSNALVICQDRLMGP